MITAKKCWEYMWGKTLTSTPPTEVLDIVENKIALEMMFYAGLAMGAENGIGASKFEILEFIGEMNERLDELLENKD